MNTGSKHILIASDEHTYRCDSQMMWFEDGYTWFEATFTYLASGRYSSAYVPGGLTTKDPWIWKELNSMYLQGNDILAIKGKLGQSGA